MRHEPKEATEELEIAIDKIADDVQRSHLKYLLKHEHIDPESMDTAFINSKGFGGNNAALIFGRINE